MNTILTTYKPKDVFIGDIPGKKALKVTEQQIIKITKQFAPGLKDFAQQFKGETLLQTAYNIWLYIKTHFQYTHDRAGTEQIRTPLRLLYDKKGDCEDFAIFAAAILFALGYHPVFYIVAFNGKPYFSHIFTVVDDVIIDGVMDSFNQMPPGVTKIKILDLQGNEKILNYNPMDIYVLQGIDPDVEYNDRYSAFIEDVAPYIAGITPDGDVLLPEEIADLVEQYHDYIKNPQLSGFSGLGSLRSWWHRTVQKVKDTVHKTASKVKRASKKVSNTFKKYGFAPARGAFLLLLKYNVFHLASKLYLGYLTKQQAQNLHLDLNEWQKLVDVRKRFEQLWQKAGGDISKLKQAVMNGRAKRWIQKHTINGLGVVATAGAAASAIAASAPFWKKLIDWLSKNVNWDKLFAKATTTAKKVYQTFVKDNHESKPIDTQSTQITNSPSTTSSIEPQNTNNIFSKILPFIPLLFIL